jgi:hypothetical protein
MISSKIAAKCYSKKKLLDKKGVDKSMKIVLVISTIMAFISIITVLDQIYYFQDSESTKIEDKILLYISHMLIAPSLVSVFVVSIVNWKKKVERPISFNEMVKHDLDDFYSKINPEFK